MQDGAKWIQTVIVDDDFLVRSYLKQLKAWEKAGYQIIADARDGEEALELAEERKADLEVIFTDISMPLVDGIELIRRLRETNNAVYIVVLSCHDDFEYVKEAMKWGADEYVLKNSLDECSLYEMLVAIKKQVEGRKEKARRDAKARCLMEMGRHTLKYHFFNGLISGNFQPQERERKREEAGIAGKYTNSAIVNMCILKWGELKNSYSPLDLEQYAQGFLQKLSEETKGKRADLPDTEIVYLGEGIFCCFADMSDLRLSSLMQQKLASIAAACLRCCKKEIHTFAIGVSNVCFGEAGIQEAYQQAREMIKVSFYKEGDIFFYGDSPKVGKVLPQEAEDLLEQAPSYVQRQQYDLLKDGFQAVIDAASRQYTDSRLILHWIKRMDRQLHFERGAEQYAGIIRIRQLLDICGEYRNKFFLKGKRPIPESTSQGVRLAVHFLHGHYKEQVGLPEAAEAAGLNPSYLSYIFKQELGIGFSAYLLNLRMEHAKALLCSTNEKVKNVAAQSGFNDYHYFSKAFKKNTGVSPADYRKQNHLK